MYFNCMGGFCLFGWFCFALFFEILTLMSLVVWWPIKCHCKWKIPNKCECGKWCKRSNVKYLGTCMSFPFHDSVIFQWFDVSNILFQVWKRTLFLVIMWIFPHHFVSFLARPALSSPFGNLSSNFYQESTTSSPHKQSPWLTKDNPLLSWGSFSPPSETYQF